MMAMATDKVKVIITDSQKKVRIPTGMRMQIRRACIAVLREEKFEGDSEVSVTFVDNEEIQKLFVQAAAEALTNAISHAQARTLYIDLNEDNHNFSVRFRNDGRLPANEITEGGGLGSLRKKIESEGGTMCLNSSPEFSLSITVPKKRREIL